MRNLDARAVGSITSGRLLIEDFGKVHEAIEWLAGHPVWTHELPDIRSSLAPMLRAMFPELPRENFTEDWRTVAHRLQEAWPDGIALAKGVGKRTGSPVDTLRDKVGDDKIVVVESWISGDTVPIAKSRMAAAIRTARNDALEEAAKCVDGIGWDRHTTFAQAAAAIRAMKEQTNG
jgi:hypothetical protein